MSGNVKIKVRRSQAISALLAVVALACSGCASKTPSDIAKVNPPGPKPHRIKKTAENVVIFCIPKGGSNVTKFIPAPAGVPNYIVLTGPGGNGTWELTLAASHLVELNNKLGGSNTDEAPLQFPITEALNALITGEDYKVNIMVWTELVGGSKEPSHETREVPCHGGP